MNKHFWKDSKGVVGTRAVDEKVSAYETEVGVSNYLTLTIEKQQRNWS